MSNYELLNPTKQHHVTGISPKKRFPSLLPTSSILENVFWFCRIRWIMIILFVGFGIFSLFYPEIFYHIGLKYPEKWYWPFVVATILVFENLIFLWHAHSLSNSTKTRQGILLNLWVEIILDLLVLTAVIYFTGSTKTFLPFMYLFHIVLSCIFLSRIQSFMVIFISASLYLWCVNLDVKLGFSVFTSPVLEKHLSAAANFKVFSAIIIWLCIWFFVSRLSVMRHEQSDELAETNRYLVKAQEEKAKNMLRTTHELKAPFAAIQVNTQLLLKGHCGVLPDKAVAVINKIAVRSRKLTCEIQEMLQLSNLRSTKEEMLHMVEVDLAEILKRSVDYVQPSAEERNIVLGIDLQPSYTDGVEEHILMLFENLLSNAILYSYEGGHVHVKCCPVSPEGHRVIIEDNGIGIPADKLPKIFDEYYRTSKAARHNKMSTGLGLTIVKHVAQMYNIRVQVESESGKGTKFILWFPTV